MSPVPPAEGERRAIAGFLPQYRIAASLILRGLRDDTLRWVRLTDPEAGRVDDIQIGGQERVDAYQVKWSQYPGSFTYKELVDPKSDSPSLVAQLADGWRRLRGIHAGHRIVVHLVTNDYPSVNDHPPVGSPPPRPAHFAAFVEQAWRPTRAASYDADWTTSGCWEAAWKPLQKASSLSDEDFAAFFRDCELEFGHRIEEHEAATTREQRQARSDLVTLCQLLLETAASPERVIHLTREPLLERLEWRSRVEFRSHHEFPVDEALYQPVEETVRRLERALADLPGGYIGVLGPPGSGKSTLLTQTLRALPHRLVRYYAFVPDTQNALRGESENFLHDVVLELQRQGFHPGGCLNWSDRVQLLDRLHAQLRMLHEDWRQAGRKAIILIDGLDHIEREQHPGRSLLQDLPTLDEVPEGVYLVLGSQTDRLAGLPDRVQHAVRLPERRVEMTLLGREAVLRIIVRAGLSARLSGPQQERIFTLTTGHPLSLVYLLNRLAGAVDDRAVEVALDEAEPYRGDIEAQYHSYWRQIEADEDMAHLVGLLARLRGAIDLEWVEGWADTRLVDRLRRSIAHYFRREGDYRWYFFHNSFRLFLLTASEGSLSGSPGSTGRRDRAFHRELAEHCSHSEPGSYWAWEELYHRLKAGEHRAVLALASPEWFRGQFFAFRPIDAINTDIRLAIRSAASLKNPVALARLALVGSEMGQRESNLHDFCFAPILLSLGQERIAAEHLREGNRLRTSCTRALQACVQLEEAGLHQEARRVFELAEPLDVLAGASPSGSDSQENASTLLQHWSRAVARLRDTDEVIATVRRVRKTSGDAGGQDEGDGTGESSRSLQNGLLYHAGLGLLEQRRWADLSTLLDAFDLEQVDDRGAWFWLQAEIWRDRIEAIDSVMAREHLEAVLKVVGDWDDLGAEGRVALAEGLFRVLGDSAKARFWLRGVDQPELQTELNYAREDLRPFRQRLSLNRMLRALGDRQSEDQIVPDPADPRWQGMVYFERGICVITRIWGEAWRGHRLGAAEIVRESFGLLHLFNRPWHKTDRWTYWRTVQASRGEFYTWLVGAVYQHGPEAIDALCGEFAREWEEDDDGSSWPGAVRRRIILALGRARASRTWLVAQLRELERLPAQDESVAGQIDDLRKQAEAWLTLGDRDSARRQLGRILDRTPRIGEKDHQLDSWIGLLDRVNREDPERAAGRIAWFAQAAVALAETGGPAQYASQELIAVTYRWSPRATVPLLHWFLEQTSVWHADAMLTILGEAIDSAIPPLDMVLDCLVEVVLPIATEGKAWLTRRLVERVASHTGIEQGLDAARRILAGIRIHALPSTRPAWRRGVALALDCLGVDLQTVGLSRDDLRPPREEGSPHVLQLVDGTELGAEQVERESSSVEGLRRLLDRASDRSYWDWPPTIARLVITLERHAVRTVGDLFLDKPRPIGVLLAIGERLHTVGDIEGAWSAGSRALAASVPYDWDRRYTGGHRLDALKLLVRVDAGRARPLTFETLGRDLGQGACSPHSVSIHMGEILPLLADDLSMMDVWPGIEAHVRVLFSGATMPSLDPDLLCRPGAEKMPGHAIADLIVCHLGHPVSSLAQAVQRACTKLLLEENAAIREALAQLLEGAEDEVENSLPVLDAASLRQPASVTPFVERLAGLSSSANYHIRKTADVILGRLGRSLPRNASTPVPLSDLYRLSLRPVDQVETIGFREATSFKPLPDSADPVEMISPMDFLLDGVAHETGLPLANLCHRTYQIMRRLAPQDEWSEQAEMRLRDRLESAGLKLGYRRPRPILARRAVFHVVAELVDAGRLRPEELRRLEPILRLYDPWLVATGPDARHGVVQPTGWPEGERACSEWIAAIDLAFDSVISRDDDGWIVLGEETELQQLTWQRPIEVRQAGVWTPGRQGWSTEEEEEYVFANMTRRLVEEYPRLRVDAWPLPLVLRHRAYTYDCAGENWLALNPTVGIDLGWIPQETDRFRWVDGTGQVMAESRWWADGLLAHYSLHRDDEVGEGWLVAVNPLAFAQIVGRYVDLERRIEVTRQFEGSKSSGRSRRRRSSRLPER
jgi:hypothetical protein